jgi:hypothetical protein
MNKAMRNIDFSGLNEELEVQLGINPQIAIHEVKDNRGECLINVTNTANLDAGLFGKVLDAFTIEGVGQTVNDQLHLPLSFHYRHKSGRTNGVNIGHAWFSFKTGEWVYEPIGG